MDFLYISPEFPPNYTPFILRLRDAGARVWGLGQAILCLPETEAFGREEASPS